MFKSENIDLAYLYEMADNEKEFVEEILTDFIEKIPAFVTDMRIAVENKNYEQTYFCAHKLKPSYHLVGSLTTFGLVEQLEKLLKANGDTNEIDSLVYQIADNTQVIINELKDVLTKL